MLTAHTFQLQLRCLMATKQQHQYSYAPHRRITLPTWIDVYLVCPFYCCVKRMANPKREEDVLLLLYVPLVSKTRCLIIVAQQEDGAFISFVSCVCPSWEFCSACGGWPVACQSIDRLMPPTIRKRLVCEIHGNKPS